ncbi:MAG: phosphatase PAP2 family protein [Geobacter sp.]|nr:MAG: phosphatase PAP2 family protein [Geobacter sp.]
MPDASNQTIKRMITTGVLLAPAVVLCILYLDVPLAHFIRDYLYANAHWSRTTSDLPDLLLLVVLISMAGSFAIYLRRSRHAIYDRLTLFAREVLWVAPSSYLAKALLKIVFGRSNTRCWLRDPSIYGFHWFQMKEHCEGFPSGHMLVITALLAVLWRFYPGSRILVTVTGVLLGLALIATNYHFLSDVLAGAYLGVLLEIVLFRGFFRKQDPASIPS